MQRLGRAVTEACIIAMLSDFSDLQMLILSVSLAAQAWALAFGGRESCSLSSPDATARMITLVTL